MATLKDIAIECGVSTATVSMALKGHHRISRETRDRITESARRLRYSPSAVGTLLRSGTTKNVAMVYVRPSTEGGFVSGEAHKIADRLGHHGYKLEIKGAETPGDVLDKLRELVHSRAADGYILWGLESDVEEQALLLRAFDQPFVARGYYDSHPDWCQVDLDHRGMMAQTIDKLVSLGHERIAFVCHDNQQFYSIKFRQAFNDIIHEHFGRSTPAEWTLLYHESVESAQTIIRQIRRWFNSPPEERPTALAFGHAGSVARTIDLVLLSEGVRIGDEPGRFAIAGISYMPWSEIITGPSWVYDISAHAAMVSQMVDRQLVPLMRGEEPEMRILRYLPELRRNDPYLDIWTSGSLKPRSDSDLMGRAL